MNQLEQSVYETSCIFCQIINNQIAAKKLFNSDHGVCILDAFPAANGHLLIISKNHFANLLLTPDQVLSDLIILAKKAAATLQQAFPEIQGFNYVCNQEAVAGQSVFHTHIHVIPKYDVVHGYIFKHHHDQTNKNDLDLVYRKILSVINQ
ncbi:HIT family protein [[Mycoplasma] cavipharyngis]|uniref:HIT family protein n=1 Tax=[Mycoplasma] cavipharyngis TaxID=92757 RepID=UPI00370434CE